MLACFRGKKHNDVTRRVKNQNTSIHSLMSSVRMTWHERQQQDTTTLGIPRQSRSNTGETFPLCSLQASSLQQQSVNTHTTHCIRPPRRPWNETFQHRAVLFLEVRCHRQISHEHLFPMHSTIQHRAKWIHSIPHTSMETLHKTLIFLVPTQSIPLFLR